MVAFNGTPKRLITFALGPTRRPKSPKEVVSTGFNISTEAWPNPAGHPVPGAGGQEEAPCGGASDPSGVAAREAPGGVFAREMSAAFALGVFFGRCVFGFVHFKWQASKSKAVSLHAKDWKGKDERHDGRSWGIALHPNLVKFKVCATLQEKPLGIVRLCQMPAGECVPLWCPDRGLLEKPGRSLAMGGALAEGHGPSADSKRHGKLQ